MTPATVTQKTSLEVLGLPSRRYREWVRAERVPHRRLGKLVIVETAAALERLRPAAIPEAPTPTDPLSDLLRRAGLTRKAGAQ